jgi:hypothetical protein
LIVTLVALNCIIIGFISVAVNTSDQRAGRTNFRLVEEGLICFVATYTNKETFALKALVDCTGNADFYEHANDIIVGGVTNSAFCKRQATETLKYGAELALFVRGTHVDKVVIA